MRVIRFGIGVAVIALLSSCTHYFGPSRAEDVTKREQVAGRWSGDGCIDGAERVTLVLSADGRYRITITPSGASATKKSGSWSISEEGWIFLDEWSGFATRFPDKGQSPDGVLLFGGAANCGDPDSYVLLRWDGPDVATASAKP